MAKNYSLVSTAKFQPMSLESMLLPLQEYTKAYTETEDALTELEAKTSMYDRIVGQNPNSNSAKLYKEYTNALKAQSDKLATEGLDINSRRELARLKKQYFSSINPIEEAYKAKQDKIKEQQTNWLQNKGKVRYSKDMRVTSLDEFLDGNTPEYTQVNLDDLYKDAATGAASRSARYFKTTEGQAFGNMYKKRVVEQGISPQIAISELMNSDKYPEFAKLKEQLKESYNFDDFNQNDRRDMDNIIERAIMDGVVYKKDEDLKANANYESYADKLNRQISLGANYGVEIDSNGNIVPVTNEALKAAYENKRSNSGMSADELSAMLQGGESTAVSETELSSFKNLDGVKDNAVAEEIFKALPKTDRQKVLDKQLVWNSDSESFEAPLNK